MVLGLLEVIKDVAAARVHRYGQAEDVHLLVTLDDARVRAAGLERDGYLKVFALVPTRGGPWRRVELAFEGTPRERGGAARDSYFASLNGWRDDVSLEDLRQKGVAFGVELCPAHGAPRETVWLQGWEDNYRLRDG